MPWLFYALGDREDRGLAPVGRLKAAGMQLLPPLLDNLHARRQRLLREGRCKDINGLELQPYLDTLVSAQAASAGASAPMAMSAPSAELAP